MIVCVAAAGKPGMGPMGLMGHMGLMGKSGREKREAGVLPCCPANVRDSPYRPCISSVITALFKF